MAHRTQITLDDRQYLRLRHEATRTGASLSELIRRALDEKYGTGISLEERVRAVRESAGAWSEEDAEQFLRDREASRASRRRMLGA